MFTYSKDDLQVIAQNVLDCAKKYGATASETSISEALGQSVSVRQQQVEQIEYQQSKSLGVTVYCGQHKGYASTADFGIEAIHDTVKAAIEIARYTEEDDCSGLADAVLMAKTPVADLSLFHPWNLSVDEAIELATHCEEAALSVDQRISNTEGASVDTSQRQFVYANSHGFCAGFPTSRSSIGCSVVAEQNNHMQRDGWFSQARDHQQLQDIALIGQMAAMRTVRRLGAKPVKTGQYPVVFEAPVAKSLIGHIIAALSGGNLYRQTSFLVDSLGQKKMSDIIHLSEMPFIPKGLASTPFDAEGVAPCNRTIIGQGVVEGYFLSSYSARKLGVATTANAGGAHNLILKDTAQSLEQILQQMGTGLLITELIGQGVNLLTGDYSRGAAGFWIENGQIVHPVEEITIAGNLNDMLQDIQAIGHDALPNQSSHVGSIMIGQMTVAGQ